MVKITRRKFLIAAATATGFSLLGYNTLLADDLDQYRKEMFGSFFSRGLTQKLTPELYQKKPEDYQEVLTQVENFFNQKALYQEHHSLDQWQQDQEKVIDCLIDNLSLDGRSLLASMKTSESIRKTLKSQGVLDFEKTLADYLIEQTQAQEKIQAVRTLLPQTTPKNQKDLQQRLAVYQNYSTSLQDQINLTQEAMFLLRWHHPKILQENVNFKKTRQAYQETMDELKNLKTLLAQQNYSSALESLQQYQTKFKKAMTLFQNNLTHLLKQAETQIGLNILGQPLAQIDYQGQAFYSTREFAQDWAKVQALIKNPNPPTPSPSIKKLFQDYCDYWRIPASSKNDYYLKFRSLFASLSPQLQTLVGSPQSYESDIKNIFEALNSHYNVLKYNQKKDPQYQVTSIQFIPTPELPALQKVDNTILACQAFVKTNFSDGFNLGYYIIKQNQEFRLLKQIKK